MIYGLGLSKVDQVRSETARRGPEPGRAAKKGFSALLLIADGCQNCSHPHMHVWVCVFIRIQFEYLFTWHSSLPSSLSSFIYFLAMRLLLVAISSDRWPKKLKKKLSWLNALPERVCVRLLQVSHVRNSNNNNNNKAEMKIKQKERQKTFCKCHATHFASLAIVTCLSLSPSPSFALSLSHFFCVSMWLLLLLLYYNVLKGICYAAVAAVDTVAYTQCAEK